MFFAIQCITNYTINIIACVSSISYGVSTTIKQSYELIENKTRSPTLKVLTIKNNWIIQLVPSVTEKI